MFWLLECIFLKYIFTIFNKLAFFKKNKRRQFFQFNIYFILFKQTFSHFSILNTYFLTIRVPDK